MAPSLQTKIAMSAQYSLVSFSSLSSIAIHSMNPMMDRPLRLQIKSPRWTDQHGIDCIAKHPVGAYATRSPFSYHQRLTSSNCIPFRRSNVWSPEDVLKEAEGQCLKHKDDAKFYRDRYLKLQNVLDAVQRDIDTKDGIVVDLKSRIGSLSCELKKWRAHRCSKHPEIQRVLEGLRRELKQDELQRNELMLKIQRFTDSEREWNRMEQR